MKFPPAVFFLFQITKCTLCVRKERQKTREKVRNTEKNERKKREQDREETKREIEKKEKSETKEKRVQASEQVFGYFVLMLNP